jgi:ferritin-like metal-binding protein YciE
VTRGSLRALFLNELRDLYDGEIWLTKVLPDLARGVHSQELRATVNQHLKETQEQLNRIEKIFAQLGENPKGKRCKGMQSLVMECRYAMGEDLEDEVRDVSLISEMQRVKHYEVATYRNAVVFANLLRDDESAALLGLTLREQEEANLNLVRLAESIYVEADLSRGRSAVRELTEMSRNT